MESPEFEYPWTRLPGTLDFPTEQEFSSFIALLTDEIRHLASNYYYDSVTHLVKLHSRYRSSGNASLEEVSKSIPLEEYTGEKNLNCIGMTITLRDNIIKRKPEWKSFIELAAVNRWRIEGKAPESFYTDKRPPLFPELCRDHIMIFIPVSLNRGRRAIVLLDPSFNLPIPVVVTEDGLPPQSPPVILKACEKIKQFTMSWSGQDYIHLVTSSRVLENDFEVDYRVYVGRRFLDSEYIKWIRPIAPTRALMFMNPDGHLEGYLRLKVEKGTENSKIYIYYVNKISDECMVPLPLRWEDFNENQKTAIEYAAKKIGRLELERLMAELNTILKDTDFIEQFLQIWEENEKEVTNAFIKYFC